MKYLSRHILLLLILLLIVRCKNDITSPTKFFSVSGTVLYSLNGKSPDRLSGIPLTIDNTTVFSGQEGEFVFDKVSEGEHIVRVSYPQYELYNDTLIVIKDTVISVWLKGFTEDYFPMLENSQIKFVYYDYSYSGMGNWYKNGEALWTINFQKQEGDKRIYSVMETITYVSSSTIVGDIPKTDTVTTNFEISENTFHLIEIKSSDTNINPSSVSYILNGASFNRYLDPREGEIIDILYPFNSTTISLKENVGFYKIEQHRFRGLTRYELMK